MSAKSLAESFESPGSKVPMLILSPETLAAYARLDGSYPDRILSAMEKEGDHRRQMEKRIVDSNHFSTVFGQILGFLSLISIGALGYLFLLKGFADDGKWIIISVTVSVVGIFVIRSWPAKSKENQF